jgi:hypothetical protein
LKTLWATLRGTDSLVGHNILEFDLPFIKQRSWIQNVAPSRSIDMKKYYTGDVFDTMQIWSNWGFKKGVKLENLGSALNVGCKSGHGTDVAHWWAVRDFGSIKSYCIEDVRLTYRVFQRLTYQPVVQNPLPPSVGSDSIILIA